MDKRLIHHDISFVAYDESPEVSEPGDGSFDDPAPSIAPQRTAILCRRFDAVDLVRADHLDAARRQSLPQRIAVVAAVQNDALRSISRSAAPCTRHLHRGQRRFQQLHFRRRGRCQEDSQRKTRAVSHHQPLCTLSTLGFSHAEAPFFAGAKLPSAKISVQLSVPCSSSAARRARQALSQMPFFSHSFSRRQQVAGEGYSSGKSFHRAPLRSTHRIPSKVSRLSARRRPPRLDGFGAGNSGSMIFQCSSVSKDLSRAIANSFRKRWHSRPQPHAGRKFINT